MNIWEEKKLDELLQQYFNDVPSRKLSASLEKEIAYNRKNHIMHPLAFDDKNAIRRYDIEEDKASVLRPAFDRDIEKILYMPSFNRYNGKTQLFSLRADDDITRRGLHVQYVSKIARNLGELLGFNTKLIEAIAIGHDLGHTPFGHTGERILNKIYHKHTNRFFNHNVHSVRVLEVVYKRNLCLQTLDGILSHNGEEERNCYVTKDVKDFEAFDKKLNRCYLYKDEVCKIFPSTLEACIVRIADIIAYLGKDRMDGIHLGHIKSLNQFDTSLLGFTNTKIINNIIIDIVENSFGKNYIKMSTALFKDLELAKKQNGDLLYSKSGLTDENLKKLEYMMEVLYDKYLNDVVNRNEKSKVFTHHINVISKYNLESIKNDYLDCDPNDIVVDFIADMTDSFFISLFENEYPNSTNTFHQVGYFENY